MTSVPELRVMRMLAQLDGGYLHMERYGPALAAQLEKADVPLNSPELHGILRSLEGQGIVASICERENGLMHALTQKGRELMQDEGHSFDEEKIRQTRDLFTKWLCHKPM